MKKIRFKKMMVNLCLVAIIALAGGSIVYADNVPTFHSLKVWRSKTFTVGTDAYYRTSGRSSVGIYTNTAISSGDTIRIKIVNGDGVAKTEYVDFVKGKNYMEVDYKSGVSTKTALYFAGRLMTASTSSSVGFSYALTP